MGLSAAQAKYLFISSRIIDVQGALMTNSMKQLALTDKSSDIAEAKEYALNAQQWQFNGNAQFDYNGYHVEIKNGVALIPQWLVQDFLGMGYRKGARYGTETFGYTC